MSIIAYTYEADFHCHDCTLARAQAGGFVFNSANMDLDEHGIRVEATDNEGNLIHPVFSTDELPCHLPEEDGGYSPVVCGDCGEVIAKAS